MALASLEQNPATPTWEVGFEMGKEAALHYVEGALEAHRKSFGGSDEENSRLQWAVTGLLERAVQILNNEVYGE